MCPHVILDFDGVILESVDVKTDAFRKLFSFVPEHVDEILRYHLENGGVSRFDKFYYIYSNILKTPLSDTQFTFLSQRFSEIVYNAVLLAPYVAGSKEFISECYRKYPIHLVTATPEPEIRKIIFERHIDIYFKSVYGSPIAKTDAINDILTHEGLSPRDAVFIGDSKNDWQAGMNTGVRFIGRVKPGDNNVFNGLPGVEITLPDLRFLKQYLEVQP